MNELINEHTHFGRQADNCNYNQGHSQWGGEDLGVRNPPPAVHVIMIMEPFINRLNYME